MNFQESLNEAIHDIAQQHQKIINDWCRAYLSQLYQEGKEIKPGCFILHRKEGFENGQYFQSYWFTPKENNDLV